MTPLVETPLTKSADELIPGLARGQRLLLAAGAVGLLLCVIGYATNPRQFFQSYLMGYVFILGITLGCLALGMVHNLSGGGWGLIVRQFIGAATRVIPVLTVLFLPILLGMHHLYEWTHPDVVAASEVLQHKHPYLNTTFFIVRAAIYFLTWNVLAYLLNSLHLKFERTGDPGIARRLRKLSSGGLLAYGLTISFAAFDWMMSLEPHWFSTIYGILIIGGQGLMGIAFLICALVWFGRRIPGRDVIARSPLHDLGNLMLAFTMLWAYFSFSQYLIIWSGNLPEEITWYKHRLDTGWRFIGLALIVFHFAVPFALLLSRSVKREPQIIAKVAGGILIARIIDLYWLIAPEFHSHGFAISWLDILLPASLGAIWLGTFVSQLRPRPIFPVHDPQLAEVLGSDGLSGEQHSTAHSH